MSLSNYRCLLALFVCGAVVFMIADGQPTTDDDFDKDGISKLIYTVEELRAELRAEQAVSAKSADAITDLKSQLAASLDKIAQLEAKGNGNNGEEQRGASYIRWGRMVCEGNATLVYKGYAAGSSYTTPEIGSGSNYLCLPEDPQWGTYIDGDQSTGSIAGVEYELFDDGNNVFSKTNNDGNQLADNPAPCALCYVSGRSTVAMIPARTQCPDGWTTEYGGYLVSNHMVHKRSSYICWDEAPEVAVGGTSQNQALVYPVEVKCGSLPCSLYPTGRELTCVVCSK